NPNIKFENGFHYRRSLSAGTALASGQQDVGHEGVATRRRVLSLPSFIQFARCGVFGLVLFPRRTGRSSVELWSQDVTGFSRPGVAALRFSHSSYVTKNERLWNLFID